MNGNPYFWNGSTLMHRDGHIVAHEKDFPELVRCREINQRMNRRRSMGQLALPPPVWSKP